MINPTQMYMGPKLCKLFLNQFDAILEFKFSNKLINQMSENMEIIFTYNKLIN